LLFELFSGLTRKSPQKQYSIFLPEVNNVMNWFFAVCKTFKKKSHLLLPTWRVNSVYIV
jgi:hypothetical protein